MPRRKNNSFQLTIYIYIYFFLITVISLEARMPRKFIFKNLLKQKNNKRVNVNDDGENFNEETNL